jgi:hypothetical protein
VPGDRPADEDLGSRIHAVIQISERSTSPELRMFLGDTSSIQDPRTFGVRHRRRPAVTTAESAAANSGAYPPRRKLPRRFVPYGAFLNCSQFKLTPVEVEVLAEVPQSKGGMGTKNLSSSGAPKFQAMVFESWRAERSSSGVRPTLRPGRRRCAHPIRNSCLRSLGDAARSDRIAGRDGGLADPIGARHLDQHVATREVGIVDHLLYC